MWSESKVAGVSTTPDGIVVVTEEGHVWVMSIQEQEWSQHPPVPNTPAAKQADRDGRP